MRLMSDTPQLGRVGLGSSGAKPKKKTMTTQGSGSNMAMSLPTTLPMSPGTGATKGYGVNANPTPPPPGMGQGALNGKKGGGRVQLSKGATPGGGSGGKGGRTVPKPKDANPGKAQGTRKSGVSKGKLSGMGKSAKKSVTGMNFPIDGAPMSGGGIPKGKKASTKGKGNGRGAFGSSFPNK